jgi:5-methylcytosine-specific restriction enzyme subunit McrC
MEHTSELFEIKFNQPFISIRREQDLLTPLLVLRFMLLLEGIVQKGLKKSYYTRKEDLRGRIKGKVAVSKTIKRNIFKHRTLYTSCIYTEFGIDSNENRLLKKALLFAQRFLGQNGLKGFPTDTYNNIYGAFEELSADISVEEVRHASNHAFYKEYREATQLAKLILQRYGYSITNVEHKEITAIPPFWIDMSKLFELYVLALLKDRFGSAVKYHHKSRGNIPDYLLKNEHYKMVIDAKYKPWYARGLKKEDIRQVSGYARLKSVYKHLGKKHHELIDCLIIYPDQENGYDDLQLADLISRSISGYIGIYKIPVKLPELPEENGRTV